MTNKKITKFYLQSGLTIVEMMLVLVIIGTIIAFGVNIFDRYREKANLDLAQSMLTMYSQELVAFQLKSGRFPENTTEYNSFISQLQFDPSEDPQYRDHFQIVPDFNNDYLLAVPIERGKHRFRSYAKMSLKDFSIELCKDAPTLYKAEGGDCKKVITQQMINR